MPVIAMTREMGSRGKDVAIALGAELDLSIVHHELVEHDVADRLHARESTVHRYLEGRTRVLERWGLDRHTVALCTAAEIFELAERGSVVIRGWGGPNLLRAVPHVLCLRVCASMTSRVETMVERMEGWSEDRARREIERNDAAHARVLNAVTHRQWTDPTMYDLVLNTDRVSVESCTALIVELLRAGEFQETEGSRRELARLSLEARARAAIDGNAHTHDDRGTINVSVDSRTMCLTLSGAVRDVTRSEAIERLTMELHGVSSVRNELQAMSRYQPQ